MILSIWRYGHLLLAISSSLFLLVASVTGAILAVEPIANKMRHYDVSGADNLSLAEMLDPLNAVYDEVLSVSRDRNGFVSATVIIDGQNESFYIDPFTGKRLGNLIEKAPIFQFSTNLHRSLFLKSPGRFFIGLSSLLLFFIAVSGIVLIAKRQGGYARFFAPVVRENFSQYHHVVYARLGLLPILILSVSGVYLSLLRFEVIPQPLVTHEVNFDNLQEEPLKKYSDFELMKNTPLSELLELEYPFSEFVEDYYIIRLKDREVLLNQYTGEILGEKKYPFVTVVSAWANVLHTGEGSILWSIILGMGSLTVPFLMITGFVIYFKRPRTKIKNKFSKDNSEFVILVGTEGGTTLQYAQELHAQLLQTEKRSHIALMNDYDHFKQMEHLVIVTATYGQGEAPSSATKFEVLLQKKSQKKSYQFSVVGFGSMAYPHFCQYAQEVHELLKKQENSKALMEVHTVNDHSFEAYNIWANKWSRSVNLEIQLKKPKNLATSNHDSSFIVLEKDEMKQDETFLLTLKNTNGALPVSGDLLSIIHIEGARERLYSIGKLSNGNLVVSVKRHTDGLCSNFLHQLEEGQQIKA
ncbi:MAG: FAD-binding oxidoreductase, partial [Pricia sp.]|nr:FAD-binding oxidoreductase [Pricia sp.]